MHPDYNIWQLIVVLPFVAAFFYVYFRIKYPWVFWRVAARQRPLAPEKRRRPGWLARLRARTIAGQGDGLPAARKSATALKGQTRHHPGAQELATDLQKVRP